MLEGRAAGQGYLGANLVEGHHKTLSRQEVCAEYALDA